MGENGLNAPLDILQVFSKTIFPVNALTISLQNTPEPSITKTNNKKPKTNMQENY